MRHEINDKAERDMLDAFDAIRDVLLDDQFDADDSGAQIHILPCGDDEDRTWRMGAPPTLGDVLGSIAMRLGS